MAHHRVKTVEPYYSAVERREKLFEVRKNDRFYQAGDTIELVWWNENHGPLGERFLTAWDRETAFENNPSQLFKVGPVLQGGQFGIEPGYCVFSLLAPTPPLTAEEKK